MASDCRVMMPKKGSVSFLLYGSPNNPDQQAGPEDRLMLILPVMCGRSLEHRIGVTALRQGKYCHREWYLVLWLPLPSG